MSSIEYRDVQYRVPRCRICSVPRCPDTDPEIEAYIVTSPENTYHRGKHGDNKVHRSSACGYNCSNSQICIKRSPLGQRKSGLIRQVTS